MSIEFRDKVINPLFKLSLPFFSLFTVILSASYIIAFIKGHNAQNLVIGLLIPYLLPLFTWRVINFFYPLREGGSYIAEKKLSPWLSSFRIQEIYLKIPALERALFLVPFLYNWWLRAWGAKIGKRVMFTPSINIVDRASLEIGDYVYFGDQCYLSSHFVIEKNKRFFCYHKKIRVGSNTFIGAFTKIGPGAKVASDQKIEAFSYFSMNATRPGNFTNRDEKS